MNCPYCNKKFTNWLSIRVHTGSCINNNKEYFIDLNEGSIHYTEFNDTYRNIQLKFPNLKSTINNIKYSFKIKNIILDISYQNYSKKEIINFIKLFVEKESRIPNIKDWKNNPPFPGATYVIKIFGSWNKAIQAAGFIAYISNLEKSSNIKNTFSKESIINHIKLFYEKENKIPTIRDWKANLDYPNPKIAEKLFGSWNTAIESAGFNPKEKFYTKEDCINAIKIFYKKENRIPTTHDFSKNILYPCSYTVAKLFETWNNAIEAAGFIPNYNDGYGIRTKAKDGVLYRSLAEVYFVNNFLYEKEVYEYETKYPEPHNRYYDFYLPKRNLYIEIDGGLRPQVIKEKIEINKQLGRNLLVITTKDIIKFKDLKMLNYSLCRNVKPLINT